MLRVQTKYMGSKQGESKIENLIHTIKTNVSLWYLGTLESLQ